MSRTGTEKQFRDIVRWKGAITYTLSGHESLTHSAAKTTKTTIAHNNKGPNAPYQEEVISHGLSGTGAMDLHPTAPLIKE